MKYIEQKIVNAIIGLSSIVKVGDGKFNYFCEVCRSEIFMVGVITILFAPSINYVRD